jgi:hypothetical protein
MQVILDMKQKHQFIENLDLYKNFEDSLYVVNKDFEYKKGDYKDVIVLIGILKLFLHLVSSDNMDDVMETLNQRKEDVDIQNVLI